MEQKQQKDMSGVLSKNKYKEVDKHPDYRGKCTIHGKPFKISAWAKEGEYGKFLSLSFTPDMQQVEAGQTKKVAPVASEGEDIEFDDEIPFK